MNRKSLAEIGWVISAFTLPVYAWAGRISIQREGDGDNEFTLRHRNQARRVALEPFRDRWLKEDALWGGHAAGNGMRYAGSKGFNVFLNEPHLQGSSIVVVYNFQTLWESDHGIQAQLLVRIRTSPRLTIEPIRRLAIKETPPIPIRIVDPSGGFYRDRISVPDTGMGFLWPDSPRSYVVLLPSCRLVPIPTPEGSGASVIWRYIVVVQRGNTIDCYSISTGQLVQRVRIPPR